MFYGVKGFGEVEFEQHNLTRRPLALVDVLKRPSKAVLYSSPLNEAILVSVDDRQNDFLQTIGQDLGDDF